MRNRILVFAYLVAFFLVVQTRDALPDNDWVVAFVATALLTLGLALWVFVARNPPPDQRGHHHSDRGD
ncbi:hypothetical protein [Pontimonas sp.]|uniref:hypothetical protein n=1 Tax=Pontimonas sp. TaxID=2304492 RepID=UPI00286FDD08|nr:hypothetical protein [Pontimonas sp.]MDR9397178.1 hypothetical protein [Pontimonas sp.]